MKPDGPSFTSLPAYEGKEFLASTDEWFRPVNVETGPDGCLYIVDMYRAVIEHPDFVPDELKKRPDLRMGDDRGRIWRVVPKSGVPASRREAPFSVDTLSFVANLAAENAWSRETAQRLLLCKDIEEVEKREGLILKSMYSRFAHQAKSPVERVHVLWLLKSIDQLNSEILEEYAAHSNIHVTRNALLAAENERAESVVKMQSYLATLPALSPAERFQGLLLELTRESATLEPRPSLSKIRPSFEENDRWLQAAALLRHHGHLFEFGEAAIQPKITSYPLVVELVRLVGGQGSDDDALQLMKTLVKLYRDHEKTTRIILLEALARGLQSRGRRFEELLKKLPGQDEDPLIVTQICAFVPTTDKEMQPYLQPNQQPEEVRQAAARLLGYIPKSTDLLGQILQWEPQPSPEVQAAVIASLEQRSPE